MSNIFKVNNKSTRTTSSSVSVVEFEQVNVSWEVKRRIKNTEKQPCFDN